MPRIVNNPFRVVFIFSILTWGFASPRQARDKRSTPGYRQLPLQGKTETALYGRPPAESPEHVEGSPINAVAVWRDALLRVRFLCNQ